MKIRSLFNKVFGTKQSKVFGSTLEVLNGYQPVWTPSNGKIYENALIRSCIDTIARNGAKLNPKHIRANSKEYKDLNNRIKRLISEQPNELMNAYDFYYKVITNLYLDNNSFIYILRDSDDKIVGLYPIKPNSYKLIEYNSDIYIQFTFNTGKKYTASVKDDVIHLKRFFSNEDAVGSSNTPIVKALSYKHIVQEGIINAIKTTQSIKGVLKTTKSMLKPEDIKKTRDKFVEDFLGDGDGSGIAGLDALTDFKEVNINPQTATDSQLKQIDDEIKNYFGVNDNLLQSKFNENEWNAFYESVLEPIGIMLGLEFTNKLFTYTERFHGNKILFEANRLQYASNSTKIQVAEKMGNYMTINEIREIFNLPPVEDGDKILQSLNYVDSSIANQYQVGKEAKEKEEVEDEE